MRPIRVALPLGIGDCHWACTKLKGLSDHHGGAPIHAFVNRSTNHNTVEYLKLVSRIAGAAYDRRAPFDINRQLMHGYRHPRWSDHKAAAKWRGFDYVLVPNGHIERGKPLHEWMPALETEYHYPLDIPEAAIQSGRELAPPGSVLLYPSGTGPNQGFHGGWWKPTDWATVVRDLNTEGIKPVLVGANTDDDMGYGRQVFKAIRRKKADADDAIGKTSTAEVMSMIIDASVWCGLNSGLGIVAASQYTPTVMFWSNVKHPLPNRTTAFLPDMQWNWLSEDQRKTYRPMSYGAFKPGDVVDAILAVSELAVAA